MVLVLSLACSSPDRPDEDPTSERGSLLWEGTTPEPVWGAQELQQALQTRIDAGIPDPVTIRDTYLGLFDNYADEDCPGGADYSMPGDYQACTSEAGAVFYGHAEYEPFESSDEAGFYLLGDCYILSPEGDRFEGGGELQTFEFENEAGRIIEAMVTGTWAYAPAEGFLLRPTSSAFFAVLGVSDPSPPNLYLDGTLGSEDGHISMDVFLDTAGCGTTTGTIDMRDPSGSWHTLTFDGSCDGCAEATWVDGRSIGEVCIDTSPILEGPMASLMAELE